VVPGRSRGGTKRSRARLEPMILGEVRGVGASGHTGGAPTQDAIHELVMQLALDWLRATGKAPTPGRSDRSGFGDLVYSVFQWLCVSQDHTETAVYALRRYWDSIRRRKKRAASFREFPLCADCKWVQAGARRDDFLCKKLGIDCVTERDAGHNCGPQGSFSSIRIRPQRRPDINGAGLSPASGRQPS
jgi:hypothetical protein